MNLHSCDVDRRVWVIRNSAPQEATVREYVTMMRHEREGIRCITFAMLLADSETEAQQHPCHGENEVFRTEEECQQYLSRAES